MTLAFPLAFAIAGSALLAPALAGADAGTARPLDRFDDAHAWTAVASDQVSASLRGINDDDGHALCLDFDFHGVSGYAAMRRALPIDYPANYEFRFRVRGEAPDNALQFKLADAQGDNVWWVNHPDFVFPHQWQKQRYKKRQIDFAWGPGADRTLRHSETIEFTVYAGKGGRGEVCFDRLSLRELPQPPTSWPLPVAHASSAIDGAPANNAVDGDFANAWRSDPERGAEQTLTLDFGTLREFGGLVLHWIGAAFASRYEVLFSDDGRNWRSVRQVTAGNGGSDSLYLPESETRYVRIALHDGPQRAYTLGEVEIKDLAFGASANAFFAELAKAAPRGYYPRGFHNEQTYWTVVGVDGGHESGLLSEDGALEVARGGFSIEPFLIDEAGALTTWADVTIEHSLQDGYLPIPSVAWKRDGLTLTTTAVGAGNREQSRIIASYSLANTSDRARAITLALAVRPFQVNPSVQFLNAPGGVSPIHDLAFTANTIAVDGKPRVFTLAAPDAFIATPFDAGMVVDRLADTASSLPPESEHSAGLRSGGRQAPTSEIHRDAGPLTLPSPTNGVGAQGNDAVHDDTGLASGALLYRISLPPHAARVIGLAIPLDGIVQRPALGDGTVENWLSTQRDGPAAAWRRTLNDVVLHLPPQGRALADTLRTALAHILISRDGAAIRPGTRAYARSWIRDGAMISAALLRLGREDAARDYLEWYAPYQFKNGKVPCCVDTRGSDPVPENDSHGELIHLASEVYRYTGDRALLEKMWPHVEAAANYMDELRASERSPANQTAERRVFYGLMPASISHEGYSAKPMHSYWDDFWALTGYKNAVDIAAALGNSDAAARLARSRDEFRRDLHGSIRTAVTAHGIDYLPGSAELGDFDATSTTIALSPAGEQADLPADLLHNTFERYWKQFVARRDSANWKDYTPYEWRTVGSFVRLGWRERAEQAITFFMRDRRPIGWNQWAEVIGRDARESRFIGDMPHAWVASDFIRATLDLFAYERAADHALVLAGGVPVAWLDGDGISIQNLRTPYGKLSYSLQRDRKTLHLKIDGAGMKTPPGGFVFAWPGNGSPGATRVNHRRLMWRNGELRISELPAELVIEESAHRTGAP